MAVIYEVKVVLEKVELRNGILFAVSTKGVVITPRLKQQAVFGGALRSVSGVENK